MHDWSSTRVIVYETVANGHHSKYVRLLLDRLLEGGTRPTLFTVEPFVRSPEFQRDLAVMADRLDIIAVPEPTARWRRARDARTFLQLLRECRRDSHGRQVVVIPDVDRLLALWLLAQPLLRGRDVELRATLMRPEKAFERNARAAAKRVVARAVSTLSNAQLYGVVGPLVRNAGHLKRLGVSAIADPILNSGAPPNGRAVARERLQLPPDRKLVMVLGTMAARKNIPLVLDCFEHGRVAPDVTAVIAGKPDQRRPEAMRELRRRLEKAENVIARFGLLGDAEIDDYLAAADALLLLYDNKAGASGMLSLAVAAGTPLVVRGNAYCEDVVRRYKLGVALDRLDEDSLADGIEKVVFGVVSDADCALRDEALAVIEASRSEMVERLLGDLDTPVAQHP